MNNINLKKIIYFCYLLIKISINNYMRDLDKELTVFSRCACLGKSCIDELKIKKSINMQKGRIDMYCKKLKITKPIFLYPYLKRFDVFNIYNEIYFQDFYKRKYKFIVMDSFSELADSKFIMPNKSVFFGFKNDINIRKLETKKGLYLSQLKLLELEEMYSEGFKNLNKFLKCNIYFILYPYKYETNKHYIKRGKFIRKILKKLSLNLPYLKIIEIDNKFVRKSKVDDFPYHFDKSTVKRFSKKLFESLSYEDKLFVRNSSEKYINN